MDTVRAVFMVLGAALVVGGAIGVVVLEFGSAGERRLVSRLRDTIEVLVPPAAVVLLVWLVWLERV